MWKKILVTCCLVAVAVSAQAKERGWYVKAIGGGGWLGSTSAEGAGERSGNLSFDAGIGVGTAAGFDFGRLRLEGEYLYQTNDTSRQRGDGLLAESDPGDFSAVVVSGNAIVEWNLFAADRATSYLGVGLAWLQEVDLDFETNSGEISFSNDAFGVQVLAGVEYQLASHWTASAELRYLAAGNVDLKEEGNRSRSLSADYDRTSLLFSVGRRF